MGPNVAWILRPRSATLVRALVLACLVLPAGAAYAASGVPIVQPDAPPSGVVVVVPTPDPPAAEVPAPAVGRAPTVVRPTIRTTSTNTAVSRPAARPRPKHATAARPHAATAPRQQPATAPAGAVLRRVGLPDGVGAFLGVPLVKASDGGLDRVAIALAGMLLAFVALGGGCLTVAVGRVAQER